MFLLFILLALIISLVVSQIKKRDFFESLFTYLLGIGVGLSGFYAFTGHFFVAKEVAASIGWPTGNPFQTEVGFSNLAFGMMGFLCFRFGHEFKLATAIGYSVFLLGAAYTHLLDIQQNENHASGNSGAVLYFDIFLPLVLLALAVMVSKRRRRHASST